MEKVRRIISSRLGFSLLSNLVTLFISLVLFRPYFEESDDVGIALIAEGAYGYREYHLIYSNTLYGRILCELQNILPAVRWHSVLMIFFTFTVFTAFVYLISENKKGRVLSVIMLASCFYELYVAVQFSKISAFIAIVSYMILFEMARRKENSKEVKILAVLALVCVTYAQILRLESFLLATMLAGCYGICLVVYEWICGDFLKKIRAYCVMFIPVFAVVGSCILMDHLDNTTGRWVKYFDYYDSVTQMVDYHNNALLYDMHGDELSELGVSENDALMYITYGSLEKRITTPELMDRISSIDKKGIEYVNVDLFKAWISNIYNEVFNLNNTVMGLIMLTGIVFACLMRSLKRVFYIVNIVIQVVISVGVLFYYQYSSRWCHRIVYALILTLVVLTVYMLFRMDVFDAGRSYLVGLCLLFVVSVVYLRLGNEFDYQEYKRNVFDYDEIVSYMKQNKDKLFVVDTFTMLDYDKYELFNAAEKDQFDNCLPTDSVLMANSPISDSIAEKYGYNDPLDALLSGSAGVFLADGISPEVEFVFCNEHNNGNRYDLVYYDTVGGINLYNIK